MNFPDPPSTTAEDIADALVAEDWLVIETPEDATGESLAIALEGIAWYDFDDPALVTPEELALLLNANPSLGGGASSALRAWRAW